MRKTAPYLGYLAVMGMNSNRDGPLLPSRYDKPRFAASQTAPWTAHGDWPGCTPPTGGGTAQVARAHYPIREAITGDSVLPPLVVCGLLIKALRTLDCNNITRYGWASPL